MTTKIFLGYKPIEAPSGGANNFLRALYAQLSLRGDFEIVQAPQHADILFMNQLNSGEGHGKHRLDEILRLKNSLGTSGKPTRLIVRAVNLRRHSYGLGIRTWWEALRSDHCTLQLLNSADFAIFQSHYQLGFFAYHGFASPAFKVIHNGANPIFLDLPRRTLAEGQRIRLVSATASERRTKRHDLILKLAACEGVDVQHFGRWPRNLPSGCVKLMGLRTHEEMKAAYAESHGFIHPAVKDPCPNAVVEALASGLPVLYGDGAGSSAELVQEHGIKLVTDNFETEIVEFRFRYKELTSILEKNRATYGISRSADEYINVFECLAN